MSQPVVRASSPSESLIAAMASHAPRSSSLEPKLGRLIAEGVAQPGKLLRARLLLASATAVRLDAEVAQSLAVALEYFHLASLLLDDLPCMDDASVRRGRPCAHRVHGEAHAILGSLAFINRAYSLIGFATSIRPASIRLRVHASVDACLGASGLVGGQARDLAFGQTSRSPRDVGRIAREKTSALLWLALLLPAVLGAAEPDELRALRALATYWGLAFQALDDLRDVLGTTIDSGKTTGRDRALQRPNLALVLGVPATRQRAARLVELAARQLRHLCAGRAGWASLQAFQQEFESAALLVQPGARNAA